MEDYEALKSAGVWEQRVPFSECLEVVVKCTVLYEHSEVLWSDVECVQYPME